MSSRALEATTIRTSPRQATGEQSRPPHDPRTDPGTPRLRSSGTAFSIIRAASNLEGVLASGIPDHLSRTFLFRDPALMMVYWSDPAVIYARREVYPGLADF